MEISAILKTSDFRGDHATDISIALECGENTKVADLMQLALCKNNASVKNGTDFIELRIIQGDL